MPEDVSSYLSDSFSDWLFDNKFEFLSSPLVLDGGNFIWNKTDTVIITTRILEDNPELTKAEIIASLKSDLSISNIIPIPPEAGDVLAHADGMVKFIDESTLFINDFLGDEDFQLQVEHIILEKISNKNDLSLAINTLKKAVASPKLQVGTVLHSDQGSQYCLPV